MPAPGVLGNDTDVEGTPLTAVLVTGPAHGTLTLNPNGSFTYTPTRTTAAPTASSIAPATARCRAATPPVSLNVQPVEDPPTATNDGTGGTFTTNEDGTLTVPAPGVLGNDVDADGDPLTATLVTPARRTAR